MHSEMHPLWQNPIQRTVRTAHLSVLMIVHNSRIYNTAQNSSDNLPSYLQTNTIAQMLSIREEGWMEKGDIEKVKKCEKELWTSLCL